MAHALPSVTVAPAVTEPAAGPHAADRQQWWADVQCGVAAMLTDATRAVAPPRPAG